MLPAKERITKARISLLRERPFFGYALMHVQIVSKDEQKPPGPKIVYDPGFVEKLNNEELTGVLCHELLHYLLGHTKRAKEARKMLGGEKDRQYYSRMNIAEDIVVNSILTINGFRLPAWRNTIRLPDGRVLEIRQGAIVPKQDSRTKELYVELTDAKGRDYLVRDPEKKSAEEVYWEIRDFDVGENGCNENEDTMYFSDDTSDECEQDGSSSDGKEGNSQNKESGMASKGSQPQKSPQELLSEAYMFAKMYGKTLAGLDRLVNAALKPKVNWKALLKRYLTQMIPYDYTFQKPSKKSPENVFLPGIAKSEHLEALVAIDTSLSIDDRLLSEFLGEVEWLINNYRSIKLTLVSSDAQIQTVKEIRNKYQLRAFTPKGGGGTDFRPVFELAAKKRAKLVVYLTDGYGDFPETPPKIATIWVVCKGGAPESCFPFGKVIRAD
jgi:predicted metal-dependent peptidase